VTITGAIACYRHCPLYPHPTQKLRIRTAAAQSLGRIWKADKHLGTLLRVAAIDPEAVKRCFQGCFSPKPVRTHENKKEPWAYARTLKML